MKKLLIIVVVLALCGMASAQGFKIGVAGDIAKPTGDWADYVDGSGWGAHAFAVVDIMVLTLTARVGYIDFGEYTVENELYKATVSTKAIPIMGGVRWECGLPVGPSVYVGAEAGVHTFTVDTQVSGLGSGIPTGAESETKFSFSPNVGVTFFGLDLCLYYMSIKDMSFYGARLGYGIGF
ncbi:MAG: hypothetical protein E4H13_11330 [Calditrichales bacterium]|nr:MAG: hypothetical protein E4H13_11330 [Calditrichales bacterium]